MALQGRALVTSLLLLAAVSRATVAQRNLTCPLVPVSVQNGRLEFSPLPPGDQVTVEYDPGALGGWFDMANGFVDTVRSGSLPYDIITDNIRSQNLQCDVIEPPPERCTTDTEVGEFSVQDTFEDFADWWAPILAVTIIGGVLAFIFCIASCVYCCCCCCFCCGCCKPTPQKDRKSLDCEMFVLSSILLLLALGLFAGVVLAFFNNEHSYRTVENFQDSVNRAVDLGVQYVEDSIEDGDTLICQFSGVADLTLEEADNFNDNLTAVIRDFEDQVDVVLTMLTDLSDDLSASGLDEIEEVLTNITTSSQTLQDLAVELESGLDNTTMSLNATLNRCLAVSSASTCAAIPDPSIIGTDIDFSQLPDVTEELASVESLDLRDIDLDDEIQEGRDQFRNVTQDVLDEVESGIAEARDTLTEVNTTIFSNWTDVTADILEVIEEDPSIECPSGLTLPDNFEDGHAVDLIRRCLLNEGFDTVQQYDVYRYSFGIVVCSLALVTVILVIIGIILGVLGFRPGTMPDERSSLSNCGGYFLLIAVGLTLVFGFFLMILCAVGFFFGANGLKVCQALEGDEYELFSTIVDDQELWNGSLLGSLVFGDSREVFSLSQALRNCRDDVALYTALNLTNLLNITEELFNITSEIDELRDEVDDIIQSFLDEYSPDDFLNISTQDALRDFIDTNLSNIDIDAFEEQINAQLLLFNLTEAIENLTTVRDTLGGTDPTLEGLINDTIADLRTVESTTVAIQAELEVLSDDVNELTILVDTVVLNATQLVDAIDSLADDLSSENLEVILDDLVVNSLDKIIDYLEQSVDHFILQIETGVAGCQPLWGIYEELYNSVCRDALDGLNGFWWSLGFCATLFIPIIILSLITAVYYLRRRSNDDTDEGGAFPLKSY